jgi:hypothetical protein
MEQCPRSRKSTFTPGAKGGFVSGRQGVFHRLDSQWMSVNIGQSEVRVIEAIPQQASTLAYVKPFTAIEPRGRRSSEVDGDCAWRQRRGFLHQLGPDALRRPKIRSS